MLNFSDLPASERMAARTAVDDLGGAVEGYYGPALQVLIPTRGLVAMHEAMAGLGLAVQSLFCFPAYTGCPLSLRHGRGYTLHANYVRSDA